MATTAFDGWLCQCDISKRTKVFSKTSKQFASKTEKQNNSITSKVDYQEVTTFKLNLLNKIADYLADKITTLDFIPFNATSNASSFKESDKQTVHNGLTRFKGLIHHLFTSLQKHRDCDLANFISSIEIKPTISAESHSMYIVLRLNLKRDPERKDQTLTWSNINGDIETTVDKNNMANVLDITILSSFNILLAGIARSYALLFTNLEERPIANSLFLLSKVEERDNPILGVVRLLCLMYPIPNFNFLLLADTVNSDELRLKCEFFGFTEVYTKAKECITKAINDKYFVKSFDNKYRILTLNMQYVKVYSIYFQPTYVLTGSSNKKFNPLDVGMSQSA
ncbi:38.5 kDa protein [Psammotettix alienus reovirus]|nr:38.5 kDa protein [Psammotettix alienus reovirus]